MGTKFSLVGARKMKDDLNCKLAYQMGRRKALEDAEDIIAETGKDLDIAGDSFFSDTYEFFENYYHDIDEAIDEIRKELEK